MPHGKLSPPRFSIRNQQRSQINADNQRREEHGAGEKNQCVALIADDILVQRPDDGKMSLPVMIGNSCDQYPRRDCSCASACSALKPMRSRAMAAIP